MWNGAYDSPTTMFISQYKIVFDIYDNIKEVGRNECIKLISLANALTFTEGVYGDLDTGFLNIYDLIELYDTVRQDW